MKRLSVVIANYNYAQYVGAAIESALALDWPDIEVIVVDDGSTDDSLSVIQRYADQIQILATENNSQRVAANRGYALTTGDMVLFLDADDLLLPELARSLHQVWSAKVSKVQVQAQRIDASGQIVGSPFPSFNPVPSPEEIRRWLTETSAYPTPPGSGNVYARWFLDLVMPVDASAGSASDSALLACAPFLGDVVSVPLVGMLYRRHDLNDSNLFRGRDLFFREVVRARDRWRYARRVLGDSSVDDKPLFRSRELLQFRVASLTVSPGHEMLEGDGRRRMIGDALMSSKSPGPESQRRRLLVMVWCLVVLCSPGPMARRLVAFRYHRAR